MSQLYPPERRLMPFSEWPTQDRTMWHGLVDPAAHILDEGGSRAAWAERTQDMKRESYGCWLNFVTFRFPELLPRAPCERITPEPVAGWLDLMASLVSSHTRRMRAVGLLTIATGAAPECDWRFLRRAAAVLSHAATPSRDKTARVRSTAVLVDLGMRLMRDADAMPMDPLHRREVIYRDGLMISFLALRPIRMRNLLGLEQGVSLIHTDNGHRILFPPEQVKTRKPLELDWPPELESALRRYLDIHRRRLLVDRESTALWINHRGMPLMEGGLRDAIVCRTSIDLGVPINPHLFRDCAATTMAIEDPEHVGISTSLLGHASLATTDKFYNQASSISASRIYQDVITKQRGVPRPKGAR